MFSILPFFAILLWVGLTYTVWINEVTSIILSYFTAMWSFAFITFTGVFIFVGIFVVTFNLLTIVTQIMKFNSTPRDWIEGRAR